MGTVGAVPRWVPEGTLAAGFCGTQHPELFAERREFWAGRGARQSYKSFTALSRLA